MMKHLTFTVIMTIAILSCKEQSKENSQNQNLDSEQSTLEEVSSEPEVNTDFVKTFEGQINNKYDIVMKLTSNNGRINGEYFYKSKGVSLSLSGDVEENGKIIMNEFDDNGNQTGMFEGIMVNENKIQGKWSNPDGSNELEYFLLTSNTNYESLLNEIAKSNKIDISGTYESPYNDGGVSSGTVEIKNVKANSFEFEITAAHQSGCTGYAEGTATLDKNINGKWSSSNCESLVFKFSEGKLMIEETNCELHGMRCGFMGEYSK